MMGEQPWYGPFSPFINDTEKNEAVNAIERDLALWRARQPAPVVIKTPTRKRRSENASKNAKNKEREKR